MSKNKGDALEIARIIATCPKSRLKYVLSVLEQAGYSVDNELIEEEKKSLSVGKAERLRESRSSGSHVEWLESTNPATIALRDAYNAGVSFSEIASKVNISRPSLYMYLRGERVPSASIEQSILSATSELLTAISHK